jgi:protein ImuB
MAVPSYDDLTPSIPDVAPGDRLTAMAPWWPAREPMAGGPARGTAPGSPQLFAAIAGTAVDRLVAIARDVSPRIERRGDGAVVADVTGLQRLMGTAHAMAAELARAGAPRVAIAATCTAAVLLARARPGITVATGDPEGALQGVPLTVLREMVVADNAQRPTPNAQRERGRGVPHRPGVGGWRVGVDGRGAGRVGSRGPAASPFEVLRGWGVTTLGELAALPADGIAARLGTGGVALQRLARGLDPRPLVPDPEVPRFLGAFDLEWPVDALEPLSFVFARVLEPLALTLARADRGAVALRLELRLTDRSSYIRRLQWPAPLRDPRVLRTLLLLDLESHPPDAAVDAVAIELDPAPARIVQYSLLDRALPSPDTIATLMARLAALVGETRCGTPVLLDSHRPDAFALGAFTGGARVPGPATPDPARVPCTLRRVRPPVAVRVAVERGRPVRVVGDRQGLPRGIVRQAAGPWRTAGGWWGPEPWHRDEWDVALDDGTVCRLFRDRDGGQWFLDAVVD